MTDVSGKELKIGQQIAWPGVRHGKKTLHTGRVVGLLEGNKVWVWIGNSERKYRHVTISNPTLCSIIGEPA